MSTSATDNIMELLENRKKWINNAVVSLRIFYSTLKELQGCYPSLSITHEQWNDFVSAVGTMIYDKGYIRARFEKHTAELLTNTEVFLHKMLPFHFRNSQTVAAEKVIISAAYIAEEITGEPTFEAYEIIAPNLVYALCKLQYSSNYREDIILPFVKLCEPYVKKKDETKKAERTHVNLFSKYYEITLKIAKSSPYYYDEIENEVAALIYITCDLSFMKFGLDRATYCADIAEFFLSKNTTDAQAFNKRINFYSSFIRGKRARGDCISHANSISDVPLPDFIIAFGDILCNQSCLVNYDDAPIKVGDIFDSFSKNLNFAEKILFPILDANSKLMENIYKNVI